MKITVVLTFNALYLAQRDPGILEWEYCPNFG